MKIKLTKKAEIQYEKLVKSGQKATLSKLEQIFCELEIDPRTGLGSPERLKYWDGEGEAWSRRISKKDRIVYIIFDEVCIVVVVSMLSHYEDK